jgi:hypothetical protein
VLKSEINSRSETTQTLGTQVLRKATVQTTFKELYESVKGGFVLRPVVEAPPDVRDARDLNSALERSPHGRLGDAGQRFHTRTADRNRGRARG